MKMELGRVSALQVGDLAFELRRSAHRRTMQITVERDGALILFAPKTCATAQLEKFVRERRFWIYTKLAEKEALHQPVSPKQYKTGEASRIWGAIIASCSCRTKLHIRRPISRSSRPCRFKLTGAFQMRRKSPRKADCTGAVYSAHALQCSRCASSRGRAGQRQTHRAGGMDLGFRWASCSAAGSYSHWKTILLPPHASIM